MGQASQDQRTGNRLLDSVPSAERELLGHAQRMFLPQRRVLWDPDEPINHVYFPVNAVVSVLMVSEEGASVELVTVGNEGMVGIAVFLGSHSTPVGRAVTQIPGEALAVEADRLEAAVAESPKLQGVMLAYTHALLLHMAQGVACNRLHAVEQRCARWLLTTRDRVGGDEVALTQEFLSQMLGVRRASVTDAVRALEEARLVSHRRGAITILDRPGLERASCECYAVVRDAYDRLVPGGAPTG